MSMRRWCTSVARVKVGPWGGSGGDPCVDEDGGGGIHGITLLAPYDRILGMEVTYDLKGDRHDRILGMEVTYDRPLSRRPLKGDLKGNRDDLILGVLSKVLLSKGILSTKRIKLKLDFPNEFLTHVSGYYTQDFVSSLSFGTNLNRSFGPYGPEKGTRFSCSVDHAGEIVGFWGRSGASAIHAIGLYIAVWNPDRFYHSMRQQGLLAYRTTSPLIF